MLVFALLGCGRPEEPAPAALFDDRRVLEVSLALDPADWDALRHQTRSLWDVYGGDCLAQPFASPFDWFIGDAELDGIALGEVGVRAKGFLGSLDPARPSLKLDLGRVASGTTFDGFDALTLNNGHQDPTRLRTCLAYRAFRDAGVPAPRCTLAHVTVNGEDLGLYANVEAVDADFLARHGLGGGELFEGTLSDLRDGWVTTFDPETGDDPADLAPAVDATASGDLDRIAQAVELESYLDFWAAEVLIGQWDGYDANTNNFFVDLDPSGRLHFLPWGPDAAFDDDAPFEPGWVAANAALPRAVLDAPGGEQQFRDHLLALLDGWDGDGMAAEAERLASLADPWDAPDPAALATLLEVVRGREGVLRSALAEPSSGTVGALREPPCFVDRGSVAATFSTTWDTLGADPSTTGTAALTLTWDGAVVPLTNIGAIAGPQGDQAVVAVWADAADGRSVVSYAWFDTDRVGPGWLPFDFVGVTGALLLSDGAGEPTWAAYVGEGGVGLTTAGDAPGDPVQGTLAGRLYSFGW